MKNPFSSIYLLFLLLPFLLNACSDAADSASKPGNSISTSTPSSAAPEIIKAIPEPDATDVNLNEPIRVTFENTVDADSLTKVQVTLNNNISGQIELDLETKTIQFKPDTELEYGTTYTISIVLTILDESSKPVEAEYGWSFTTAPNPDDTATQPENIPPTVVNPGQQASNEGESVSILVKASDPNGDTLVYSATGLPGTLSIDPATGLISGVIGYEAAGQHTVTVTVSDGTDSASVDFAWTIENSNQAPELSSPGDLSNNEGDLVSLNINAQDGDGDTLEYSAVGLPNNLTIDTNTGAITGTIKYTSAGVYDVAIFVSDGNTTSSTKFTWTINDINRAPQITPPGPQNAAENIEFSLQITANDPDEDSLTFSASGLPEGVTINDQTGLISGVLQSGTGSEHTIEVTVSDNGTPAQSASTSFNLFVNDAPVITTKTLPGAAAGQTYTVTIEASDSSQSSLKFELVTAPNGMTIDAQTGQIAWNPQETDAANNPHAITVKVMDAETLPASSSKTFNLNVNGHPVFDTTVLDGAAEGLAYSYSVPVTDPNGDKMVFSANGLPSGLSMDTDGTITGTPAVGSGGRYTVSVTVTDFGTLSLSTTENLDITVNGPPEILTTSILDASTGKEYTALIEASDVNGDTLSYSLVNAPAGMTIDPDGNIHWIPAIESIGLIQFDVIVKDNGFSELETTKTFSLNAHLTEINLTDPLFPQQLDIVGASVDIDGDMLVVGTPYYAITLDDGTVISYAGGAYIFKRIDGTWNFLTTLTAYSNYIQHGAIFGIAVAISGDTVVIGASGEDITVADGSIKSAVGAVYVFKYNGENNWSHEGRLIPDNIFGGENFGGALDISEDTVVVGNGDYDGQNVYVFNRNNNATSNKWSLQSILDFPYVYEFGNAVSIYGDTIAVGASGYNIDADDGSTISSAGAVYIYNRDNLNTWNLSQIATAAEPSSFALLGSSVAVEGNMLIAGASNEDITLDDGTILNDAGSAHIFYFNGSTWEPYQILTASNAQTKSEFGNAVAIDGNTIAIGSPDYDLTPNDTSNNHYGSAYVFLHNGTSWQEQSWITASDAPSPATFGKSVAIDRNSAIIGAPDVATYDGSGVSAGAAYLYLLGDTKNAEVNSFSTFNTIQNANLAITINSYTDIVLLGEPLTYNVIVSNYSLDSNAAEIPVNINLPVGTEVVYLPAVCKQNSQTISCVINTLVAGAMTSFDLQVLPNKEGVFTVSATVNTNGNDPIMSNNFDEDSTNIINQ